VNSLSFSRSGQYLIAGVGQEHRLGRWWRLKEARNGVMIIRLPVNVDMPNLKE
jgi:ribosomal RNA-processing protein 9